ncbi:hypothetical protein A6R70_26000 [Agrobacterium rubi]|uniref:DUF3422 domain-containing protein n=1 Tax=Agrobacterium rubi TaxID=28099 RepID=UPI00201B6219|nr:DUF3422 domain-containing protein [Agrobacterium rubi]MCL6655696.1 hypothetical protein [Agrobacterium rubi]
MSDDFNAELHARPPMYIDGPAFVEHVALMPNNFTGQYRGQPSHFRGIRNDTRTRSQVEYHTEFVTVTIVTELERDPTEWPRIRSDHLDFLELAALKEAMTICRTSILIVGQPPVELRPALVGFGLKDPAVSVVGVDAAYVCSDFQIHTCESSRVILYNKSLNAHRLGRMVRRVYEIETYRSMALLALPEARRLAPLLVNYDAKLVELSSRNLASPQSEHRSLLDDITALSSEVISATAQTRNRFGATSAYSQIVDERINEMRESRVEGFQRFGVFVSRRFKPAVRTCSATAVRLDELSRATMHLIDLLQTRIQVEIESQNSIQMQTMAERAAVQIRIQRAVEGFSIIAISYYLLSLLKVLLESLKAADYHVSPMLMLVSIPFVIGAVALTICRVRHALKAH